MQRYLLCQACGMVPETERPHNEYGSKEEEGPYYVLASDAMNYAEDAELSGFHRGYRAGVNWYKSVALRYGKRKFNEGREYQQKRLTNHDMHSGLACLTNYQRGNDDMLAKVFNNPDCVWGEGECVPDCPSCRRLDELIAERAAGYKEAIRDCIAAVEAFDHDPLCMGDDTYCCSRNVTLAVLRGLGGER